MEKSMSQTFSCPNCTANLEHDGGNHLTVQCPFCSSTVIVPENLRPRAYREDFAPLLNRSVNLQEIVRLINLGETERAIALYQQSFGISREQASEAVHRLAMGLSLGSTHIQLSGEDFRKAGRSLGCFITAIVLLVIGIVFVSVIVPLIGGGAAVWAIVSGITEDESGINIPEIMQGGPTPTSPADAIMTTVAQELEGLGVAVPMDSNASSERQIFAVGERGISPGQFNDARSLAIGNDGTIHVADRDSGRLQTFATDGTYQSTLAWDKEKYTDDLELSPDGTLYAEQSGRIYRYDPASADLLGEVVYTEDIAVSFSQLALTVNGDLLAINRVRNSIVRFDAAGNVQQTITIESIPAAVSFDNLAVDGVGNIYVTGVAEDVLGDRQDVVFKFTAEGQFASQFGSSGNEPGLFMGIVSAIAVDGQGHIYVADFQGVQVFDNNGRFLELLQLEGVAFDMAITSQNELVAVTSQNKLYKFDISDMGN
jgi:sugar lactone lactonase YvrE